MAVLAGASYWFQVDEQHDAAECQAQYNQAFSSQLTTRSNLFQLADDTRDELLLGISGLIVAKPPKTPAEQTKRQEQFRNLFTTYTEATNNVSAARKSTPLPELPNC